MIEAVRPLHNKFDWEGVEMRLIQSEMMPWAALGRGLIDRDFLGYEECHRCHANYLEHSGLSEEITELQNDPTFHQFLIDQATLSRKDLKKKYPDHEIKQYEALSALQLPEVEAYNEAIEVYGKQREIHGADGELQFKPFNLLKTVYENGKEVVNESNIEGWEAVTDEKSFHEWPAAVATWIVLELSNTNESLLEGGIAAGYRLMNALVGKDMEGVVVKPESVRAEGMAPMFKVRNNDYLQMIYGINFQTNYDYYLSRRGVGKKMRCSINEWGIAQRLLRIPMAELDETNVKYQQLIAARIKEEFFEAKLDPRL
jgi:hypothetical protein